MSGRENEIRTRANSNSCIWRFVITIPVIFVVWAALYIGSAQHGRKYEYIGIIDKEENEILVRDDDSAHKNDHKNKNRNNNTNTSNRSGNGSDYSLETIIEQIKNETVRSINTTNPFLPRPWQGEKPHGWCWKDDSQADSKTPVGLMFVKTQKASSSTLTGVTLHLAHRYGESMEQPCLSVHEHSLERYPDRDKFRSFLFTSIREPAARAMSWLQYLASNQNQTDDWIFSKLEKNLIYPGWTWEKIMYDNGYQLGYLSATEKVSPNQHNTSHLNYRNLWPRDEAEIRQRVDSILEEYDLILLTERMDESLVALQLILNLTASDLLYVHGGSKLTGNYVSVRRTCHLLRKVHNKTRADEYFTTSKTWMRKNWGDYLLYHSANALLDATIESLGRKRFQTALDEHRDTLQRAQDLCDSKTIFPCSSNGTYVGDADCYAKDWGCGYKCLNREFPPR